ncbi:TIGR02221 family CRISPR-associated protein [Conchiformibius steedae]|nr:TIGR02221 family CRISPR-associated protein [Conchiformibius steedae]
MKKTLISFLGNARKSYDVLDYDWNGQKLTTEFIGVGLAQATKPEKLLLVGTSGSMWDVFLERQNAADDEHIMQLMEAVENNAVTEALLQPCLPHMAAKLGCEVACIIIEYARNEAEQIDLLQRIAQQLNENERISIDVTHSFRHLPMLSLVASRFLKQVKNIRTDHIYYAAMHMAGKNPVIELNGMLKMLDWVDALSVYNHNGSYREFVELFQREQADDAAKHLENASFFENTNQIHQARSALGSFRALPQPESPLIGLFQSELNQRTEWVRHSDYASRQLENAKLHLEKGDYLRCGILAHEAWLSKMTYAYKGDASDYAQRDEAAKFFVEQMKQGQKADFDCLNHLRNALAHGSKSHNKRVQHALKTPEQLRSELNKLIRAVEQWQAD